MDTKRLTIRTLLSSLASVSDHTRLAALRHLHLMSNQHPDTRPLIAAAANSIPLLADALYSSSHPFQEHAAATLLNLSISDRRPLISTPRLLDALSHVLSHHSSTSSPAAVQSSAATLHSLLVVDEYRPIVGSKHDVVHALLDIISSSDSPTRSVKDALKASFGVALHPPNRSAMVRLAAVPALFGLLAGNVWGRKIGIMEDATAVIAQIAGCEESEEAFRKVSGIPVLVGLLGSKAGTSSSLRTKENAVSGLLNLVRCGGERVVVEVRERALEALDGIVYVQENGSAKGKSKAVALLEVLLDGGNNDDDVGEDLYPVDCSLPNQGS